MGNQPSTINQNNNIHLQKIQDVLNANTETFSSHGGVNNLSETSEEEKYTESKADVPFYKEYIKTKKEYLNSKVKNNLRDTILNNY